LHEFSNLFVLPDWYRALTLSERAAAWRTGGPGTELPGDTALGRRRLARWRAQPPFLTDGFLPRRLAREGIGEGDLGALLGEPPESLAARTGARPAWLLDLERAFTTPPTVPFPRFDAPDASLQIGFLEAVRPLLDAGYASLTAGIRELADRFPTAPFDPETAGEILARNLPLQLLLLLGRTMALELHLAGQEGRLTGETPEERFASFVEQLRDPAAGLAVLCQYPVLARQVVAAIGRWVDFSLEILGHLAAAADRLRAVFSPDVSLGFLTAVRAGQGDTHGGGRAVAVLRFDSGLELVYKPRSLAVEVAFQKLLEWTGTRGWEPTFRCLRVVEGEGDYGWAELASAAPCASAAELERFYLRQGGYLALLFVLSATDMHHENLIAAGEHPILVDLEALFHPRDAALGRVQKGPVLPDNVLRIGFLPNADWGRLEGRDGVDLSGLAASDGQVLSMPMLQIEDPGTDQMRFVRRPLVVPIGQHRPTLGGDPVPVTDYIEAIDAGFRRMALLLATHRDELMSPSGPLAAFADTPVRVLVRSSMAYATLVMEGQHPYALGDALERDRLFDRLWSAVPEFPAMEGLLAAEQRDLLCGDIPIFRTTPGSRDILTSDGEVLADFLGETSLSRAFERLRGLDTAEIERQAWIVRNSLEILNAREAMAPLYEIRETAVPSREDLVAGAVEAGRRLEALAFRDGPAAFWFVPDVQGRNRRFLLTPAGPDLHLGIPGIALFLAHLGAVTGEDRFTCLARAATVTLRGQIAQGALLLDTVGAFSGWGGILYTLTHLGVLWGDGELLDEAERIAATLGPLIDADEVCDVVGGAAGCLVCLLGLHTVRPAVSTLEMAVRCGERILARALPMERGIGWVCDLAGPTPLAGFSHGAAGISWALLHLAAASGDDRFRRAAQEALSYERSLYSAAHANWPDLRARELEEEPHFMCAWCHGAAGIALGRLDSLRFLDDAAIREDAAIAVGTTVATGFGTGHCLCHGDLGNLESLVLAAETLGTPGLAERAGRLAGGILEDIRERGWRFGVGKTEVPGLMLGLAGGGYGLLRLAEPQRIPAVLRLAPPGKREVRARAS